MSATVTYTDTSNMFSDSSKITLDKINQGGGGGSGGSASVTAAILAARQVYIDRDPAAPNTPSLEAINVRSDGGAWTRWNPATAAWA